MGPLSYERHLCYKPKDANEFWEDDFYGHAFSGSNWLELFYMSSLCCAPRIVAKTMNKNILKYFHVPTVEQRFGKDLLLAGGASNGTMNNIQQEAEGHQNVWQDDEDEDSYAMDHLTVRKGSNKLGKSNIQVIGGTPLL